MYRLRNGIEAGLSHLPSPAKLRLVRQARKIAINLNRVTRNRCG